MAADARTDLAPPGALTRVGPRRPSGPRRRGRRERDGSHVRRLARATPICFPDEYIYSEVGRSIAEHGRPLVRGGSAPFPALLQPLLTAPAWLFDDVATSFRTIQLISAVVMSLGAVAVFWLARRLGSRPGSRLRWAPSRSPSDMLYSRLDPRRLVRVPARPRDRRRGDRRPRPPDQGRSSPSSPLRASPRSRASSSWSCPSASSSRSRSSASASTASSRRSGSRSSCSGSSPSDSSPSSSPDRGACSAYDSVVSLDLALPDPPLDGRGRDAAPLLVGLGARPRRADGPRARALEAALAQELGFAVFGSLVALAVVFEAALYAANGADRIQERCFFAILPSDRDSLRPLRARFPHRVPHALIAVPRSRSPRGSRSRASRRRTEEQLAAPSRRGLLRAEGRRRRARVPRGGDRRGRALHRRRGNRLLPRIAAPLLVGLAIAGGCVASFGAVSFGHRPRPTSTTRPSGPTLRTSTTPISRTLPSSPPRPTTADSPPSSSSGTGRSTACSCSRMRLRPTRSRSSRPRSGRRHHPHRRKPYTGPLLVDSYGATAGSGAREQVARTRIYRLWKPTDTPDSPSTWSTASTTAGSA